eukprot:7539445-Pyramimonas_sp.AAC.2
MKCGYILTTDRWGSSMPLQQACCKAKKKEKAQSSYAPGPSESQSPPCESGPGPRSAPAA